MDRLRHLDVGGVLIGLIILGVGIYSMLVNMFGISLPELDWDKIWPLAVIALGIGIITTAWTRRSHGEQGPHSA